MTDANPRCERLLVFLLRMALAWTFLYAASHQVFVPGWSATGFLTSTKTFHFLFAPLTNPRLGPVVSFLVEYGHLAIGLSLLFGVLTRVGASAAIMLMFFYWLAHMDFPFISDTNNLLVDMHVVYALVLGLLIVKQAGHIWGLDGWLSRQSWVQGNWVLACATTQTPNELNLWVDGRLRLPRAALRCPRPEGAEYGRGFLDHRRGNCRSFGGRSAGGAWVGAVAGGRG
ncbi:MAG: DoxX family protein [Paracoccaceae bacterium]